MKTQKTLTTIFLALAVAANVLSAQTPDQARAALKALNVFKDSLSDWFRSPNCAPHDSQCLQNKLALVERMARDAKDFLEKSPALFSYNGDATDEQLAPQRAVFAKMEKIAGLAISYRDALVNAEKSPTQEEKTAALIAQENLYNAVVDFAKGKS